MAASHVEVVVPCPPANGEGVTPKGAKVGNVGKVPKPGAGVGAAGKAGKPPAP